MGRIIMRGLIIMGLLVVLGQSCGLRCNNCSSGQQCLSCEDGYYLQNNSCLFCPSNCLNCISGSSCSTCVWSYYLVSNLCEACSSACATCSSYSLCTACYQGYFLENSKCLQCRSLCAQCTTGVDCQGCIAGLYLLSGQCVACDGNCLTCLNQIGCSVCYDGYYAKQGGCVPCEGNCIVCSSAIVCSACGDKFYLNKSQCASCSLCSNQAYCEKNGICPMVIPSKNSTASQAGPGTDPGKVVAIVLVPIVAVILLFIGVLKLVNKCSQSQVEGGTVAATVDTKGTIPTVTEIPISKDLNGQSQQHKESGRPILIDRNDTL